MDIEEQRKRGRPLLFESEEDLQEKIASYFQYCDKGEIIEVYDKKKQEVVSIVRKIPYTVSGLCLYLDCDRKTIINYSKKDEFFHTIKRAKVKIENNLEVGSLNGSLQATPCIFNLKNNFEWVDKSEVENTGNILNITLAPKRCKKV